MSKEKGDFGGWLDLSDKKFIKNGVENAKMNNGNKLTAKNVTFKSKKYLKPFFIQAEMVRQVWKFHKR